MTGWKVGRLVSLRTEKVLNFSCWHQRLQHFIAGFSFHEESIIIKNQVLFVGHHCLSLCEYAKMIYLRFIELRINNGYGSISPPRQVRGIDARPQKFL